MASRRSALKRGVVASWQPVPATACAALDEVERDTQEAGWGQAANASEIGICRLDALGNASWDDAAARLLGVRGKGGGQFLALLKPAERAIFARFFARLLTQRTSQSADLPIHADDGEVRWLRFLGVPEGSTRGAAHEVTIILQECSGPTAPAASQSERAAAAMVPDLLARLPGAAYQEAIETRTLSYVSSGVEELTGIAPAHFISGATHWWQLVHPADLQHAEPRFEVKIDSAEQFDLTYRIVLPDGELRWVRDQGRIIRRGLDPLAIEGYVFDVSDLKRRESELQKTAEEACKQAASLAAMIESTLDCIFVLDHEYRFVYLNKQAQEHVGPLDQLLGAPIRTLFAGEENSDIAISIRRVMQTRCAEAIEYFLKTKNRWYEAHIAPSNDGVAVFFRDITDRRQAQDELVRHTERAFGILDRIPQITFSCDAEGACHYLSPQWAEFTGQAVTEGLGRGWLNAIHKADFSSLQARLISALQGGESFEIECRARHSSGSYRWIAIRAAPRRDADGIVQEWFGTCADVHDRVLALHSLAESEALNRSIIESSTDCIQLLDLEGRIRFANKLGPSAKGIEDPATLLGKRWSSLLSPRAAAKVEKMLVKVAKDEVTRFTIDERMTGGSTRWWDVVASPMQDAQGRISNVAVVSRDITYQKRSEERANWLAKHDSLTNLPNRLFLQNTLDDMIRNKGNETFALLLLDIDNFKTINDTLGHDAGDALLRAFAIGLKGAVRRTDFIARLGGDEFAVVLTGVQTQNEVQRVVDEIQSKLREPILHGGRILESRASIGGVMYPAHGQCRTELLKHADIALYVAKAAKDCFEFFRPNMRDTMQKRLSMLSTAKEALKHDWIEPFYQPKIDLLTGHVAGFEALLRCRHPVTGVQLPETISAAFDDLELAADISNRIIEIVIEQARDWLDRGVPFGHVAVNAAAAEFRRGDFAEQLLERLHKADVPTKHFHLEVTETVFLGRGAEYVERALKKLSCEGVQIVLDDFGTGYASLSHLKQFPVATIKIDRSFVQEIGRSPDSSAIARAVINLGKSLNISVVAEGIETLSQERALTDYGCDYGQGFLYSRAMPAENVENFIVARQNKR